MTKRRNFRRRKPSESSRQLHHQTLEKRELLAAGLGDDAGPRLISVAANSGEQFDLQQNNVLSVAPKELKFRFDGGQEIDPDTLDAFQFTASGGDGTFGDGNELNVDPGFIGLEQNGRIVVVRFAEDLPDDQYEINISSVDQLGSVALRNIDGDAFCPTDLSANSERILMDVEVGPRVVAVVPQPITGTGAARAQQRNQIYVYFNNETLANADSPQFYNLFLTSDTVETGDDVATQPTSVEYQPDANRAVLTFAADLSVLALGGSGTFRLRVGSSQPLPTTLPTDTTDQGSDVGDMFATARDTSAVFGATDEGLTISGEIEPTIGNTIEWPGIDSPGVREDRRNAQVVGRADTNDGIDLYYYNFASLYGRDPSNQNLENAITPAQQQRTREILDLYADHLGVQFVETEQSGLQIVTGDLRAVAEMAITGPGAALQEYRVNDEDPSRGLLILDAAENWFDGYGLSPDARPSWFVEALRGVGSLMGIGDTFEQVPGVASGSNPLLYNSLMFPNGDGSPTTDFSIEPDFLSSSDIIPGQALHRPEIRDTDLYRFAVDAPGRITVESFAQRLLESSLLDTDLKLWRLDAATGEYELVARNNDFYGDDSFVGIDVQPNANGTTASYVIGITASGNEDYDPTVEDSGSGGRSQGSYQMKIAFQRGQADTIEDSDGSRLDGDSDGRQGGDFNFWFRVAKPLDTAQAGESRTLFVDSFAGVDSVAAGALSSPFGSIDFALGQANSGDIVRLLPNGGADGQIATTADNRAYAIGSGLVDGATVEVPQGVTLMIDAGAILKLQNSKISVGSESIDEDRSMAALQVLGTPVAFDMNGIRIDDTGPVHIGSYTERNRDGEQFGSNSDLNDSTPAPGDWAGIEFRNDVDRSEGRQTWATEGIFLDYVSHADIRYGGGSVTLLDPAIAPLQMFESRPTLIYNQITKSRDAALSADPNSFAESTFHSPVVQQASMDRFGSTFTSDYDRVGPMIRGNVLLDNSINGLFVPVITQAGSEREPMTVSGRFDDPDIVHSLSEVLVLQGAAGGPTLNEQGPDLRIVTLAAAGGSGAVEAVDYRLTFVTRNGFESLASEPTRSVDVAFGGSVTLNNLPIAPDEFNSRRLYRITGPGSTDYELVAQLDRGSTQYIDDGTTRGGLLPATALDPTGRLIPRLSARLSIDPGIVVKLDSARIEAAFGADFYAEGTDGDPVVFTSRLDDRYGAGGTFDTNNDSDDGAPAPGDWAGLVFRQGSTASIDNAVISFGGGESATSGGFASFNAVEILQADVRIANSQLSNNASGFSGGLSIRDGIGFNGPGTIFTRGAQPIIVANTIIDNEGAAISINPDSLNYQSVLDQGRSIGPINQFITDNDNQGPLIAGNRLDNNAINGLLIRDESLTTESVWDDTDMVHVVDGQVYAWNYHHRSGLRLKSDPNRSLVVKFNSGGSIIADRYGSDTVDAIGGTIQVIGQQGFPVVLTSLRDDTVGAGFTPDGVPQTDTDNATENAPAPGDWYGIVIDAGANDRNVAFVPEAERAVSAKSAVNAIPDTAQRLGSLARNESSADENRRLGFNVRGSLSQNGDLDVYAFTANGGTQVHLDIDDTDFGLDTVIELIDVNGNLLALSNDSLRESNDPSLLVDTFTQPRVFPLRNSGAKVVENPNRLDAGMRVILPGNSSTVNTYYVRVRSSNGGSIADLSNPALVGEGLSDGQYGLQIRLRETDEVAGSMVRLADIRYATNSIDVVAAPNNSPLAADHVEAIGADGTDNNGSGNPFGAGPDGSAQFNTGTVDTLGAINISERGVLRTSGTLGNHVVPSLNNVFDQELDVDVFEVQIRAANQGPDTNLENRFVSTIFDIDYADQSGGPNTSLAVYDVSGRLILHARDSNVADDQGQPTEGNDADNLAGGSAGTLDAYIGPVELPEGTYFVAVTSAQLVPEPLNQMFLNDPEDTNVRVLPIDSIRRIAEEGFFDTFIDVNVAAPRGDLQVLNTTAEAPTISPFFDETSIVPYALDDVRLFISLDTGFTGNNQSVLISVDPVTGVLDSTIGEYLPPTGDLAIRRDGELFAYSLGPATGPQNNGNTGNLFNVSSDDATEANVADDGLIFNRNNEAGDNTENDPNAQLIIEGMAFIPQTGNSGVSPTNNPGIPDGERALAIGFRDTLGRGAIPVEMTRNIIYSTVANTGAATNRGSTDTDLDRDFGDDAPYSTALGAATNKQELGIVNVGQFPGLVPLNPEGSNDPDGNPVNGGDITGIAIDPDQLFGFGNSNVYGVTDLGYVYSFDPTDPTTKSTYQLYDRVIQSTNHGRVPPHPEDDASNNRVRFDDMGNVIEIGFVEFTSVTLGPRLTGRELDPTSPFFNPNLGPYAQTLFGITSEGWIYTIAVDDTDRIQPAPVLANGNYAIPVTTGFGSSIFFEPTGIAFSTREENPWHITGDRGSPFAAPEPPNSDNAVHGSFTPYDNSQIRISGAASLYFGFEIDSNPDLNTLEGQANGTLNPGGVHGSTVSAPFSLQDYNSGDKPTLYFSYFLATEDNPDFLGGDGATAQSQADSFRVFATGDDGQWRLVSTNDTWRSFVDVPEVDEYDYFQTNGGIPVQETFENTNVWRQARIDLSAMAGHKNVQLRFDFSTGGGMSRSDAELGDLIEIQAVEGSDLVERTTFRLFGKPSTLFSSPSQFVTFEFVQTGGAATGTNVPIFYDRDMTVGEVRAAIQTALALGLTADNGVGAPTATPENFNAFATNRIRFFNYRLSENNSAIGFSELLPGDEFGSVGSGSISGSGINTRAASNNNVEGIYIDDIIVGFAERGEVVFNAPVNQNFDVLPETRTFVFADTHQPEFPNEQLIGDYTLEIRQGAEFGVPEDFDPVRLRLNEQLGFGRSFDTNDRQSDGVSLIFPNATELIDGDSFVLSDGTQRLTFEFDTNSDVQPGNISVAFIPPGLPTKPSTDAEVARAVRDAINGSQADALGIFAAGRESNDSGPLTSNRVELFGDVIQVNPSEGRFVTLDLGAEETFYGRESGRTLPAIDHENQTVENVIFPDTFARASVTDYINGATDTLVAIGKIEDRALTGDSNELLFPSLFQGEIADELGPYDALKGIEKTELEASLINDFDIVKIYLNAGDTIDVDIDATGWGFYSGDRDLDSLFAQTTFTNRPLLTDPLIEIFSDATGTTTPLAVSPPATVGGTPSPAAFAPGESNPGAFIDDFTAASDGYYYVRISSRAEELIIDPISSETILLPTSFGEYQLTIRPGDAVTRDVVMVDYAFDEGDLNVVRDQGQLIIDSNFISHFASAGVLASFDPGAIAPENLIGNLLNDPNSQGPGAVALLRNPNIERLLPGTVISNNVIVADAGSGIVYSGNVAAAGQPASPVPFGRIYNNTVVGSGLGTGIEVSDAASPTLLNNLVTGFETGINIADDSLTTVTGGNAFQNNGTDSNQPLATSSIVISPTDTVYQDAAAGIYIPAAGSAVIDSSFASLNDRAVFFNTVKAPVGISASPIIAPSFDANGVPRFDDPTVATPGGVGSNVFIDRGALDRADFVGPTAILITPQDFIGGESTLNVDGDSDPSKSFVRLTAGTIPFFEIQLLDPSGTGPDARTITPKSVILTENGNVLEPGVDYILGYSDNSRVIRLTPLAGLWRNDAVYDIELNSVQRISFDAPAGNTIADGDQVIVADQFGAQVVFEFDDPNGDSPGVAPGTTQIPFDSTSTSDSIASALRTAINDSPLTGVTASVTGETLLLVGANSLRQKIGTDSPINVGTIVPAVTDIAGNRVQETRDNDETRFTILAAEVILDFGDAPASYGTLLADSGPRHTSNAAQLPRLGDLIDGEADGQPIGGDDTTGLDDEDGVLLGTFTDGAESFVVFIRSDTPDPNIITEDDILGFLNPLDTAGSDMIVNVAGTGLLNVWVDFDGSGTFDPSEQVVTDLGVSGDPIVGSPVTVNIATPSDTDERLTWMRVRLNQEAGLGSGGVTIGGEVEDYQVNIVSVSPLLAVDDQYTIVEDFLLDTNDAGIDAITANDTIPTNTFVSTDVTVVDQPTNGTLTAFEPDTGRFQYVPNADFFGTDTFTYRLGTLSSATLATVTINVTADNDQPIAIVAAPGTTRTIDEDAVQTFTVAQLIDGQYSPGPANESTQPLFFQSVSSLLGVGRSTQGGNVAISGDGLTITYTPPLDYNSQTTPDTFNYVVADAPGAGQTSEQADLLGTVVINFVPVNDPPRPRDDSFSADENQTIIIPIGSETTAGILMNDFEDVPLGEEGQMVLLVSNQFPKQTTAGGTVSQSGDMLVYIPPAFFSGVDTFEYLVRDQEGATASATVSINVANTQNQPIVIGAINGNIDEDETLLQDMTQIFDDPDGQTLTYSVSRLGTVNNPTPEQIAAHPLVASIEFIGDQLRIELDPNQSGNVEIQIRATDTASLSESTTFTLSVAPVADPPRLNIPTGSQNGYSVPVSSTLVISNTTNGLLRYFSDGDGDTFTVDVANIIHVGGGQPLGTLTVSPNGTFQYINSSGSPGDVDRYQYRAIDSTGLASATVQVAFTLNQSAYQNPLTDLAADVNADGKITAIDALRIINFLGRSGGGDVPVSSIGDPPPDFYDVNGDGTVSALDALNVVNELGRINNRGDGGEQPFGRGSINGIAATAVTSSIVTGSSAGLPIRNIESTIEEIGPAKDIYSANDQIMTGGLEIASASADSIADTIAMADDSEASSAEQTDSALTAILDDLSAGELNQTD